MSGAGHHVAMTPITCRGVCKIFVCAKCSSSCGDNILQGHEQVYECFGSIISEVPALISNEMTSLSTESLTSIVCLNFPTVPLLVHLSAQCIMQKSRNQL